MICSSGWCEITEVGPSAQPRNLYPSLVGTVAGSVRVLYTSATDALIGSGTLLKVASGETVSPAPSVLPLKERL